MLCYAAKAMRSPDLANPTIVLITDRNDLDDQLYGEVFAPARILPEAPKQATSRAEMRRLLDRTSGGIVFSTLQKFAPDDKGDAHPVLTERRNVVVIADEAHRSQYDFLDGYARHLRDALPNATYLGFTGTPIESGDKSTRAVFGDYIDVYDLTRAVEDGATVRIFYESRLAKVKLPDSVDFQTAAAAMLQGMTAHYLTHSTFELKPGHTCLIHAAAGGGGCLNDAPGNLQASTVAVVVDFVCQVVPRSSLDHVASDRHRARILVVDVVSDFIRAVGCLGDRA